MEEFNMEPLRWRNPGRKRIIGINFNNPSYVVGYDLDNDDFAAIVGKLKDDLPVSLDEDKRYGIYIRTMMEIVLENAKFKNKTVDEKYGMRDTMYYELCSGIRSFDVTKKSGIFSYAYRIAYVAGIHYFTNKTKEEIKKDKIKEHCLEELQQYIDSITDHKIRNFNKE